MAEPVVTLSNLTPAPNSRPEKLRVGRGIGSGRGKTAGRGVKGQKSRTGKGSPRGFEGGQNPLVRRVPKFGFNRPFRVVFDVVNLDVIQTNFSDGDVVDPQALYAKGLVKSLKHSIKVLGNGSLNKKITVKAHKFSKSAIQKINHAGGSTEEIKLGSG